MKRRDLYTNEEFIPKRINQVFATSANRIAYHNKKANELRHFVSYIDKPLHKNLKILNEVMAGEKFKTFHKEFLKGKGFCFNICNHLNNLNGKSYFAIYQYTLISLENEKIKIIKND